jgi:hypothetical protein
MALPSFIRDSALLKQAAGGAAGILVALVLYGAAQYYSTSSALLIRPASPQATSNLSQVRFNDRNVDDGSVKLAQYHANNLTKELGITSSMSSTSSVMVVDLSMSQTAKATSSSRSSTQTAASVASIPGQIPSMVRMMSSSSTMAAMHPPAKPAHLTQSGDTTTMLAFIALLLAGTIAFFHRRKTEGRVSL